MHRANTTKLRRQRIRVAPILAGRIIEIVQKPDRAGAHERFQHRRAHAARRTSDKGDFSREIETNHVMRQSEQ